MRVPRSSPQTTEIYVPLLLKWPIINSGKEYNDQRVETSFAVGLHRIPRSCLPGGYRFGCSSRLRRTNQHFCLLVYLTPSHLSSPRDRDLWHPSDYLPSLRIPVPRCIAHKIHINLITSSFRGFFRYFPITSTDTQTLYFHLAENLDEISPLIRVKPTLREKKPKKLHAPLRYSHFRWEKKEKIYFNTKLKQFSITLFLILLQKNKKFFKKNYFF